MYLVSINISTTLPNGIRSNIIMILLIRKTTSLRINNTFSGLLYISITIFYTQNIGGESTVMILFIDGKTRVE